jgi:YHS domain-containing protein
VVFLLVAAGCDRCAAPAARGDADRADADAPQLGSQPATEGWEEVDPYCGMRLRRSEAAGTAVYRGRTYYFCLPDHRDAFMRDPDRYLGRPSNEAGPERPRDGGAATADAGPDR